MSEHVPPSAKLQELSAVNAWQGRKIARLLKALRYVAEHSNDPAVVREAEKALAVKEGADA